MRALSMDAVVKGLAKDKPLESRMLESPKIAVSVNAPAQGQVIEYHVVAVVDRDAVRSGSIGLVFITEADAKIPGDEVTAVFNLQVSVRKSYPFTRGGLPGNGQVRHVLDLDILFQPDRATKIKYDGSRSFDRIDAFPE